MSLATDLEPVLEADNELMDSLTGSMQVAVKIDAGAFNADQRCPCALVKSTTEIEGRVHRGSIQTTLSVLLPRARSGGDRSG